MKGYEDFLEENGFTLYSSTNNDNIMNKVRSTLLIFLILFSSISAIDTAYAHSMFNSAEKFYGGYRVQVATAPEFPQIDEPSQFLIRVTDGDFEEVDSFTMGIPIVKRKCMGVRMLLNIAICLAKFGFLLWEDTILRHELWGFA